MSSLKTTVSIEGELVDLAEVFKALASAAAATPRPEPRVSGEPLSYNPQITSSSVIYDSEKQTLGGKLVPFSTGLQPIETVGHRGSGSVQPLKPFEAFPSEEGSTDEPETQEQSEQTGKRKRRTKAEIEADRLAAEQAAIEQANGPADDVAVADEAVNAFEAGITAVRESEEPEMDHASTIISRAIESTLTNTEPAPKPVTIPNAAEPATVAPAPQPNTTSATVDGTSPFIAELRAFCQQKMLGKPENQVLIKNLLTEFGAAGLSALKEVDKMAFKQRLEALPFK